MTKTKIIATIGPTSEDLETLKKMAASGMNMARLNMSHNTHEYHEQSIKNIREAARESKKTIGIILDLQGVKIRLGKLEESGIFVKENEKIVIYSEGKTIINKYKKIPIQLNNLSQHIKAGQTIYIDDGFIELKVKKVEKNFLECVAMNEGWVKSHKGVNIPKAKINHSGLTKKDLEDLEFGIKNSVDYVALSYVESAQDITNLRSQIEKLEKKYGHQVIDFKKSKEKGKWSGIHTRIIAKIESEKALENFEKILEYSDGIMIARGDLGMEIPMENLPILQKQIIAECLAATKPVIVATQMLGSLIENPQPTRAEVSDVANAVLDGADAIMLSGETANGRNPIKSIDIMRKISLVSEKINFKEQKINGAETEEKSSVTKAIAQNCKRIADQADAKLIVCTTTSGFTARVISSLKPKQPVIALTPSPITERQLALSWNVQSYHMEKFKSFDDFINEIKHILKTNKLAKEGDVVAICTGHPLGYYGNTNLIKIEII